MTSAVSIYSYGNNDIVIPIKVLEEIDKHKKRQDSVGSNARNVIKIFDELQKKAVSIKVSRLEKDTANYW